jgi:hypothetical protein
LQFEGSGKQLSWHRERERERERGRARVRDNNSTHYHAKELCYTQSTRLGKEHNT